MLQMVTPRLATFCDVATADLKPQQNRKPIFMLCLKLLRPAPACIYPLGARALHRSPPPPYNPPLGEQYENDIGHSRAPSPGQGTLRSTQNAFNASPAFSVPVSETRDDYDSHYLSVFPYTEKALQPFINGDTEHNQKILFNVLDAFDFPNTFYNYQFLSNLVRDKSLIFVHLMLSMVNPDLEAEVRMSIKEVVGSLNENGAFAKAQMELRGVDLRGVNLCNMYLGSIEIVDSNMSDVTAPGLRIVGGSMERVNLEGANLDGACICFTSFKEVHFINASLVDAKLSAISVAFSDWDADCTNATFVDAEFSFSNLDNAKFIGAKFIEGSIIRSSASANFTNAQVSGTVFLENTPEIVIPKVTHPHLKETRIKQAPTKPLDLNAPLLVGEAPIQPPADSYVQWPQYLGF